jgi:hypothetical protein
MESASSQDPEIQAAIEAKQKRAEEIGKQRAQEHEANRPHIANAGKFGEAALMASARVTHARELIENTNTFDEIDRVLRANEEFLSHDLARAS